MKDTCLIKMEKALNLYTILTERNHIHETLIMVHYYHFLLLAIIVNPFQCLIYLSCSDLGCVQNTGPTKSALLWSTQEPEPEQLRLGKCIQTRACIRQFPAEQPRV